MLTTKTSAIPKFSQNQQICSICSVGKISNYRVASGAWLDVAKMTLELEINIRGVNSEAEILLHEIEIS